jgi:hypothetical protein
MEFDLISRIKQEGGFDEVSQVILAFDCCRKGRKFRVEITDSGNPSDNFRYMVNVKNPNGTTNMKARGNGGKEILHALQVVHWGNLEMDENVDGTIK